LSTNMNSIWEFGCRNWKNSRKIPARNQNEIRTIDGLKKCLEPCLYLKRFSKPTAAILIATWIVYMLL